MEDLEEGDLNSFIEKRFTLILFVSTIILSAIYYLLHGGRSAIFVGALVFTGGYHYGKIYRENPKE